jgi:NAD-specific glutamate dehydrogenase
LFVNQFIGNTNLIAGTMAGRQGGDLVIDVPGVGPLALPTDKEIRRRQDIGAGLTSPELATLMAHVKLALKEQVLASDLPDQEVFAARLPGYFPAPLREGFSAEIRAHQLRREIVTTMLVNKVVDTGGITFAYRVTEDALEIAQLRFHY